MEKRQLIKCGKIFVTLEFADAKFKATIPICVLNFNYHSIFEHPSDKNSVDSTEDNGKEVDDSSLILRAEYLSNESVKEPEI